MSFKDLEAEIKAWANLEAYAHQQKEQAKEAKRAAKRQKREQKLTGPLTPKPPAPSLQKPLKTFKRITIECRNMAHRVWGEVEELTFEVETISDTDAEVKAIKLARERDYSYDRTVCISTFER